MASDKIVIKGARENNLQNIDLELPRDKMIVITGLSGSGKSSLAFDTLYAEGQRRYMESLSSYARQFLGQMEKPDVDYIGGLSPAISIDQKGASHNPRSTVGTVTEIYDYLRLLYARIGLPHCPQCGREIKPQTVDQMTDLVLAKPEGSKILVLAPIVHGKKGQFQKKIREVCDRGFARVRIDGEIQRVDSGEEIELERYVQHNIEAVVDRITIREGVRQRVAESLETSLELSGGTVIISDGQEEQLLSQHLACAECGLSFSKLEPRLFSFNTPHGACSKCTGLGFILEPDPHLVIPDESLSLNEGAIAAWGKPVYSLRFHPQATWFWKKLYDLAESAHFSFNTPWKNLSPAIQQLILNGTAASELHGRVSEFEGVLPSLSRRYVEVDSDWIREEIGKFMTEQTCPDCQGQRLKPESRAVTVKGLRLPELCSMSVHAARSWFEKLDLTDREQFIARQIIKELNARLGFLDNVGLDYLTLSRSASTLSGGEAQRIRLATQIGSGLVGVLYILDEPSIGLHQRDNRRLLQTLCSLRDLGNTLIVVEHDEDTIREADFVVDIGPGAGVYGGKVVAKGTPRDIEACQDSITGAYLSGAKSIALPDKRRPAGKNWIEISGCRENNLKNIEARFPVGLMTCVTGVSGSGKSTLVNELLYKGLASELRLSGVKPGAYDKICGKEHIDKVIVIDQSPIGRTPRSNPATYTGLFDPMRQLFAATPEARLRGYQPGRFSFNVKGGRCEACQGQGILKIEMHFLPDVFVPCEVCGGSRYSRETLEVRFKGKNIAEVLDMTVAEAVEFFENQPRICNKLQTLYDVGLGYIRLGQAATTLSGGEAQRVKLATELSRRATAKTLYILDEPTTGLHFDDVARLMSVLQRLVSNGSTMVIIEHNLDVIKSCDWIIDLGPEGGDRGGTIIAQGSPEQIAQCESSWTGQYLKKYLV
ncbi:MAG: excinuclease ABC subunit UvrA [bacterium]|nr:excinuclease ABC subunit UvrA [bacterium]